MCVICCKFPHSIPPSDTMIRQMWHANSDGAGFATTSGKVFKSLDLEEFIKEFHKVPKDEGCVLHFRYATNGSVCIRNVHQFTNGKGIWFCHNGILYVPTKDDMTDSETFFRSKCIPLLKECNNRPRSHKFRKEFSKFKTGWSKFAFVDENTKEITMFGDFIKDKQTGLFFSNLGFMRWSNIY